ncbi:hypothetical protein AVEN_241494-1 [Araneus ventricosus]|uniref:Uncharacterized protein n=1 Tax=Araneus ventricosus TaxID=182803 RepID=A0A4Y2FJC0_ARAVE|nr:hypothetical protein AVEN_241494-1 [Araneus ventricosus]
MLLVLVISIFIGILTVLLRYSLWRNKCSQLLPGKKPRFLDILGDAKDFAIYDNSPNKYFSQMNFFDVIGRRAKEFRKHQLFCLWITFVPFVCIVKAEAVKITLTWTKMTSEEGDKKGVRLLCRSTALKRGEKKGVGPFCRSTASEGCPILSAEGGLLATF